MCDHARTVRQVMYAQGPTHTTTTALGDEIRYAVEAQVERCAECYTIVRRLGTRRQYYGTITPLVFVEE